MSNNIPRYRFLNEQNKSIGVHESPELIQYNLMPQAPTPTKSSLTEIHALQSPAIMPSLKNQHRFRSVDPNNRPPRPGPQQQPRVPKGVADIRQTKEYKTAARRWISVIVALPILMVSSYTLYERREFSGLS
ncbi:unnamed protein product [Penicillium salamii]|nr:unnamed protein product [Penicillium salamii]